MRVVAAVLTAAFWMLGWWLVALWRLRVEWVEPPRRRAATVSFLILRLPRCWFAVLPDSLVAATPPFLASKSYLSRGS